MSLILLEAPAAHSFSKNRIPIHLESSGGFNVPIRIEISYEKNFYGSGIWEVIGRQLLYTDTVGRCYIDISSLVDGIFEDLSWPDISTATNFQMYDRILQIEYEIVETGGDTITDDFQVYCGGIPKEYELSVDPVQWFLNNDKWFTHKPLVSVLSVRTPEYITLKMPLASSFAIDVKFVVTDLNGTLYTKTVTIAQTGISAFDFYVIAAGYNANALQALLGSNLPAFYTVTVYESGTSTVIAEKRKYIIDHLYRPFERFFLFRNSIGGVDTLRTIGEAIPKSTYTDTDVNSSRQINGIDADYFRLESFESHAKQINTGFKSKAEIDWLRDFRLSKQVYEVEMENLEIQQRIILTKTELIPSKDNQDVHATVFEYKRATDNETYSPNPMHD